MATELQLSNVFFPGGGSNLECPACSALASRAYTYTPKAQEPSLRRQWVAKLCCDSIMCTLRQKYWYVCRFCPTKQGCRTMRTPSHLKKHELNKGHRNKTSRVTSGAILSAGGRGVHVPMVEDPSEVGQDEGEGSGAPTHSEGDRDSGIMGFELSHDVAQEDQGSGGGIFGDQEEEEESMGPGDQGMTADDNSAQEDEGSGGGGVFGNQEEEEAIADADTRSKREWIQSVYSAADNPNTDFVGCFPDDQSRRYFEAHSKDKASAATSLVSYAYHGDRTGQYVHPLTALHALRFTRLGTKMSEIDFIELADLVSYMIKQPVAARSGSFREPPIPKTKTDMENFYNRNRNSILRNLPHPKIEYIGGHTYISPIECVRDLMGHGLHVDPLFPGASVHSKSKRGRALLSFWKKNSNNQQELPVSFLLSMIPWMDDIDPSNVKGNRKKVWVYLLTIGAPESRTHKRSNTYVISIGPGDANHDIIEQRVLEDLKELSKGVNCYFGPWQKPVLCFGLVYATLADRPAKAKGTYTLAGNSTTHQCYGVVGVPPDNLPSCDACHNRRKQNLAAQPCTDCRDWALIGSTYDPPEKYPDDERPVDGKLTVKRLTFQSMTAACNKLYSKVAEKKWKNKTDSRAYMQHEGITQSLCDSIYEYAKANPNSSFEESHLQPPTWQEPLMKVSSWTPTLMHQLFLGIVKATFGDLVKAWLKSNRKFTTFSSRANELIVLAQPLQLSWLKLEPLSASDGSFGRYVSENYLAYVRVCKWLYCDLAQIPNDPEYKDPDKALYRYSSVELKAWLVARQLPCDGEGTQQHWLSIVESIIASNGGNPPTVQPVTQNSPLPLAEELICSVLAMISRVMVQGDVSESDVHEADRHIKMFLTVVSKFDGTQFPPPANDRDAQSKRKKNPPFWICKYNFLSLLEIPVALEEFGSLRLLWEGDGKGEGALPPIKDAIKSLKGRWPLLATERWYQNRALLRVTEVLVREIVHSSTMESEIKNHQLVQKCMDIVESDNEDFNLQTSTQEGDKERVLGDQSNKRRFNNHLGQDPAGSRNFYIYKGFDVYSWFWSNDRVISAVGLSDGSYGIVVRPPKISQQDDDSSEIPKILSLDMKMQQRDHNGTGRSLPISKVVSGACYISWSIKGNLSPNTIRGMGFLEKSEAMRTLLQPLGNRSIKTFLAMLPILGGLDETDEGYYFYSITSNYEEIDLDGCIGFPKANGVQSNS